MSKGGGVFLSQGDDRLVEMREQAYDAEAPLREPLSSPGSSPRSRGRSRLGRLGIGCVLFSLAVLLPLFRQRGVPSWQTIWAEDGQIFFEQANREGGLAVMFRGFAGYLHLPPRVLGALATLVPIAYLPIFLATAATLVGALLAWFLYWSSAGWVTSRPVRLALASLLILMPALGPENTATIAYVTWFFIGVAPWAMVCLAERHRDIVIRAVVAFFAATSTAVAVVFLPLAIGYVWIRRTRATWLVAGAFGAGLAVQAAVVLEQFIQNGTLDTVPPIFERSPAGLAQLVAVRVLALFLVGHRATGAVWLQHGRLLMIGAAATVAVAFAVLYPGAGRKSQLLASAFLACSMMSFAFPVWGRGTTFIPVTLDRQYVSAHLRYSIAPVLLLASAAAVLIAPAGPGRGRRIARIARACFVAHTAALILIDFSVTNLRSGGPRWSDAIGTAYRKGCIGAAPDTIVPVKTDRFFLFPVHIPCSELAAAVEHVPGRQ